MSLRSYYSKKNQAWTNHCSVICKAIPFNFFTDFGNVNPDQKKLIAIRHSVNLGAAAFLARVFFSVACENIRFSPLFAARDVSRGETSATQRQKFHTDDPNQCLHIKYGSQGVPNINLSNFTCLLVDFGKVFCLSANELQQNSNASSREDYIPQILTVLLEILRVYI